MKYLLIFLILTSCGKHTAPAEKDLRDSDGDGSSNEYDSDKFKADVVTMEKINAVLEFETGRNIIVKHTFNLGNNIDLQEFSKDLMVKKSSSTTDDDFFSEFSVLKIREKNLVPVILEKTIQIQLFFSKVLSAPRSLILILKNKKVRLKDWKESMNFSLTQEELESILKGESHFSLSHMDNELALYNQTQEERIIEKNYRVVYNDGRSTEVHYFSKELSLENILRKLNVQEYKLIAEQNLLTTTIMPLVSEWWVRINKNDIIIINENLRHLSNHYLHLIGKTQHVVNRSNGFATQKMTYKSPVASNVLLKIRADRTQTTFTETSVNRVRSSGPRDNEHGCIEHTRTLSSEFKTILSTLEFNETLLINGQLIDEQNKNIVMRRSVDEIGEFWEIIFSSAEQFEISLNNLPESNYLQIGQYQRTSCAGSDRNAVYRNNLQTLERNLTFQIEAYVENI